MEKNRSKLESKIKEDEAFLIEEGIKKAYEKGLQYNPRKNKKELILLASKEFPQTAFRYVLDKRKLDKLKKSTISIYELQTRQN